MKVYSPHSSISSYQEIFSEEEINQLLSATSTSSVSKGFKINMLNKSAQLNTKTRTSQAKRPYTSRTPIVTHHQLSNKNKLMMSILLLSRKALRLHNNSLLAKGIAWITSELTDSFAQETINTNNDTDNAIIKIDNINNKSIKENLSIGKVKQQSNNNKTYIINNPHHHKHQYQSTKPKKPLCYFNKLIPHKSNQIRDIIKLKYQNNVFTTEPNSKEQTIHSVSSPVQHHQPSFSVIQLSEAIIQTIDQPTFNIFDLEGEVGQENTLSVLSSYIFISNGFYSIINPHKADAFVQYIRKGYDRSNSYHNDLHAADVLHTSMIFTKYSHIANSISLTKLDLCALFVSAIVHDFKHPGVTNGYLIQTSNKLALRYNDSSPLENFHIAQMFKLIKTNSNCDIFSQLSKEDYSHIRKRMLSCVLSTDLVAHKDMVSFLTSSAEKKRSFGESDNRNEEYISTSYNALNKQEQSELQQEYMNVVLHSSDISNPVKPFKVYSQWAELVVSEFFTQGDKEREMGMPISYLCDRTKVTIPQSQIGFIDNIILPLYTPLIQLLPGLSFCIEYLNENREQYQRLKAKKQESVK